MPLDTQTKNVKIHTRTILILGATVFILIFAMNLLAQFFILSSYAQIEREESVTDVQRVLDQIRDKESTLAKSASDWAVWNDSYFFMENRNDEYRQVNIEPITSYESLHINGLLYYDTSGDLVIAKWYDLQNRTATNVPPDMLAFFSKNRHLLQNRTLNREQSGLVLTSAGPVLVCLYPILPNDGTGPNNGTLIMARSLDPAEITELENLSRRSLTISPLSEMKTLPDPDLGLTAREGRPLIITRPKDSGTVAGYAIVRDINNNPILLLEVDSPRTAYQQALATLAFLIFAFIVIGIIYVTTTEVLLRRYIVSPLQNLDHSLKQIGHHRDLSWRLPVSGDDEVASLKTSLNTMLQDLQEKETELARRGELLSEANRKANLYLDIYLDVLTYEILNSTMSIQGYAELLETSGGNNEKLYARRISEIITRDAEVIRNMETISRIFKNPPARQPVNLDELIRNVLICYPEMRIRYQDTQIQVLADPMLSNVFHNIISNSIKFGGAGSMIEITTRDSGDNTVEISVTDNGPGIADTQKPGIFDRFTQGSEKRSSYGLGLHIAKMLIEAYGGRIWADDRVAGQPGQGAAIRFILQKSRDNAS
jgi:signal transduction histidine kinase